MLVSLMHKYLNHMPKIHAQIEKKLGFHELQIVNLKTGIYKFTHITTN